MSTAETRVQLAAHADETGEGATLPRLLEGIRPDGHLDLDGHLALHGPLPQVRAQGRRRGRDQAALFLDEIERSGLLGQGGAAFPAARKMRAVASAKGRAIVIGNGSEGEPASQKDRTLMHTLPHLVLDGGIIAAESVGADELILAVCQSSPESVESMAIAIEERGEEASRSPRITLQQVPSFYIAGQETALVNHLEGRPALPSFTPPRTFEQGLRRRPTLVSNVETLAHIALIARHGSRWFRRLGTGAHPGSTLVTLSGAAVRPGVYEIEHGASLTSLVEAAGGAAGRVAGALIGGYAGAWIPAAHLRSVALSNDHLAAHGANLGAGVVALLSDEACPVAETARLARWLSGQSARQCGPCVNGLDSLARSLEQVASGTAPAGTGQRISRLASLTSGRGACGHPDGAVNMILSALEAFEPEFTDHARRGSCPACSRGPELPLPAGRPPAPRHHGKEPIR